MKLRIFALIFLALPTIAVANDATTKASLTSALELWQPSSIVIKGTSATVTTKENRVTEQIYLAMVGGVCTQTLLTPDTFLQLTEIKLLNRHGRQGYVFMGGEKDCKEYVKLPISKTKIWVLGRTRMN